MSAARILVVDDHDDTARMLALLLETLGYTTRTASTGEEALLASPDYQPDGIVLDLSLPDMTGFELAKRLKVLPGLERVKLIAVTGWSDPDAEKEAKALGFRAFLVKPVDPMQLEAALK
jgi:CheY-like chemotaxis protein